MIQLPTVEDNKLDTLTKSGEELRKVSIFEKPGQPEDDVLQAELEVEKVQRSQGQQVVYKPPMRDIIPH